MNPEAMDSSTGLAWPPLPLESWSESLATLHMWTQIVGKTPLALAPMMNHWWQIALRLTPRGMMTPCMPSSGESLAVEFDFINHRLRIMDSRGGSRTLPLLPQSVADFHAAYMEALKSLGHDVMIRPVPVEVELAIPFPDDREHASYDAKAVGTWWRIMIRTHRVLERFRSRFIGKSSPIHFFWGSFDLAHTRFSGRTAPRHPGGVPNCPDWVMVEAYSHECSSCGFWPGGGVITEPAFYAYAWPEPGGYSYRSVQPGEAFYSAELREFILPYEAVRRAREPEEALLAFFQTTYEAAADSGGWNRAVLERTGKHDVSRR